MNDNDAYNTKTVTSYQNFISSCSINSDNAHDTY